MRKENIAIGCIGLGNMGSAICVGLAHSLPQYVLYGYDIDQKKVDGLAQQVSLTPVHSLQELSHTCDVIIIAVKPINVQTVASEIALSNKQHLIISVAAGITLSKLSQWLGTNCRIIRCMPNTPALIGKGISVLSSLNATQDDIDIATKIFSALGTVLFMPEHAMDAVTALSGSGPAYVFTFIQALTDAGVKLGLSRADALLLAAHTVAGAAHMVLNGEEPFVLRGKVTSPGGTTIEAIHVLEKAGFSGIVMDAVVAAYTKSKKLGEQ